jgi:hypothetical protein
MKKLSLLLSMLLMMFLFIGCAMEENVPQEISLYASLKYDWESMTFTQITQYDILNHVGNPFDDFVILHEEVTGEAFTVAEFEGYEDLFSMLTQLSNSSGVAIGTILTYSSQELKDRLAPYSSIQLTLNDIVTFNTLKSLIEEMKAEIDGSYYLSKINYIEKRLSIDLSDYDIHVLEYLQDYYSELVTFNPSVQIALLTFEELMIEFESIGYIPNVEARTQLESAHQIIIDLVTE